MILVHVIPPENWGGHRHEERFADGTTDAQILDALTKPRHDSEGNEIPPLQAGYGRLRDRADKTGRGVAYLDHAMTVVAIGHDVDGQFVEDRRLRGPAAEDAKAKRAKS